MEMQDTNPTHPSKTNASDDDGPGEIFRAGGRLLRSQAFLLLMIVFALALAEATLRVVHPALSGLVYARDMTGGHPIELTPQGYRIGEADLASADAPRVLGLGDSTTFGTGVSAEQTWPSVLQNILVGTIATRNAGAEGAEVREFAFGLQQVWTGPEQPEIAVLMITANMISFTDFRWDNTPRDPRRRSDRLQSNRDATGLTRTLRNVVQSSALLKAMSLNVNFVKFALGLNSHRVDPQRPLSPLMAYGWVQPDLEGDLAPRMWQRFEQSLGALQAEAQAQGVCLIVGFLPSRFDLSDDWLDNLKAVPRHRLSVNPETRLRDIAARLDLPFADTAGQLRAARARTGQAIPLYIPGDYTHLDAAGHDAVAAGFADLLRPILQDLGACRHQEGTPLLPLTPQDPL
jgi:lysophospholipase L1-like esterase